MESEVRPATYSCFFLLRSRKFLTALILYSSVASLIAMIFLNSTKTIKVLQGSRGLSADMQNLTQKRLHDRNIPSVPDVSNETDFIFSKNIRGKDDGPLKRNRNVNRSGSKSKCGGEAEHSKDSCNRNKDVESVHSQQGNSDSDRLHTVLRHYKSMVDLQPLDFHCDSCALVSSSGQLINQRAGKQIDQHSCVLRMNLAPTKGFELDVGSKTTARIVCFISTAGLKTRSAELLSGSQQAEKYLFWGLNTPKHKEALGRVQILTKSYDFEFFSLDEEGEAEAVKLFEKETGKNRAKTNSWLSTGWFTMMLAIDMCDKVHVYGMVPDDYCRKYGHRHVKYHYWQNTWGPSECDYYKANEYTKKGGHRFLTEKAIFQRWALKHNISFHYPGWNLDKQKKLREQPINTPFMRRDAGIFERRRHH